MSRVLVIVMSSLILVGLIGVVSFGFVSNWEWSTEGVGKIGSSSKAVRAMCQPTDYKVSCMKSLSSVRRPDDPKELVRAAFTSAKSELTKVANESPVLKELEKDPKTADAVKVCRELFQFATDDFDRSLNEVGRFEWNQNQVNDMLSDVKIWISATRTYQETCLDAFQNTTSDATDKVRKILKTAIEMSSNGLAIVNDLSSLFSHFDLISLKHRKLLSHPTVNRRLLSSYDAASGLPLDDEDDGKRRKLLSSAPVLGHSVDGEMWPDWADGFRRKLLESPNLGSDLKDKANVVVAQDGSGKYKTIEEALKEIPKKGKESFIIYIKEGVYKEYLVLYKWMTNVVFIGDGPTKTRITNDKNFIDGVKTFKTATLSVMGDYFMAKDIGFENSAGAEKHQAVAFLSQSDKSIFFNCHFDGYQDTLYTHTYRQIYRNCRITGTIDFVFGDAAVFFQNCTFVVRKPLDNQHCIVTAQGRMERHQPTGIFIHKSKFEADPNYLPLKDKNKAYLGRPWKEFSVTIIMESEIGGFVQADGWLPWEGNFGLETCYYGEYHNYGAGSSLAKRVKWHGIKTIIPSRAQSFMPRELYDNDDWIKDSGIPYEPNLSTAPGPTVPGVDEDPIAPVEAPLSSFEFGPSSSTALAPTVGITSDPPTTSPARGQARTSTQSPEGLKISIGPVTIRELERILMANEEMDEDDGDINDDMAGYIPDGNEPSPAPVQAPSPAPSAKLKIGPVTIRELERILMENEEMEEDKEGATDDKAGDDVPDGDEPSPAPAPGRARVEPPSPSGPNGPAPTPSNTIAVAPSSEEEIEDWLPPVVAPVAAEGEADKVPPTTAVTEPQATSSGSKTESELYVALKGMIVMWVALLM